jgi:hypothetical protein
MQYAYSFGIPALQERQSPCFLPSIVNHRRKRIAAEGRKQQQQDGSFRADIIYENNAVDVADGRGGWTDIALRRSIEGGKSWGQLQIICSRGEIEDTIDLEMGAAGI